MARISLDPPHTVLIRIGEWYSRRVFGAGLDSGKAYAHHARVLLATTRFERGAARWNRLDPTLKSLAVMAVAARIGCSWCPGLGYRESRGKGVPAVKVRNVPVWRDHDEVYTDLELLVMEYAEAMTETPPAVTDEMTQCLIADLGEPAFVELTATIAVENLRSRMNSAFGLVGQGLFKGWSKDRCEIPLRRVASEA
jgi:alkylhydroperoxidase family enzyme